jgi:membrane associated rhomboid family serine protease
VPVVTILLIVINVLVFLYEMSLGSRLDGFVQAFGAIPREITTGRDIPPVAPLGNVYLTLLTSMFLHGGWLHLGGNMIYLWVFGDNVEDRLGTPTYLLFYLLCGIAAAIGQGLVSPGPMLGASGAIAGVLGAYLVLFPGARIRTLIFLGIFITVLQLPAIVVIGFFIVIQFIDAFGSLRLAAHAASDQVAYFAHLFGFFAGIVLILVLRDRSRRSAGNDRYR